MKYYLIAGEASGDLHASHVMRELRARDEGAEFRYYGGDRMKEVGGTLVRHYRELAYMGFIPVLLHLRTILRSMRLCLKDIREWKPDVVILVDYPGFNLRIARALDRSVPVIYYIAPKLWAWKEYRIRDLRRYVDRVLCILPFEVEWFGGRHGYEVEYVGNPTLDEVEMMRRERSVTRAEFCRRHGLDEGRHVLILMPGSRMQEIRDNLHVMLTAVREKAEVCSIVIAGAPSIERGTYEEIVERSGVRANLVYDLQPWTDGTAGDGATAIVTSGTATLEMALWDVPQVVCYNMKWGRVVNWIKPLLLSIEHFSLVNLIAGRRVVTELLAAEVRAERISMELESIMPGTEGRERMLEGYAQVRGRLGRSGAAGRAAERILSYLCARG